MKSRARPVLFLIDDDPGVVQALQDDPSRRFSEDFQVMGAVGGGATAVRLTHEYLSAEDPAVSP